jgi:membrane protein DedA with SNARE-associated domain
MQHLVSLWFHLVQNGGYLGIILLMALESSIVPVPSEVVIPPAAFWAVQGKLNFWGVIAAGTFGSWLGSAVSYWLSRWLGRVIIVKYGKYFLISEEKLTHAEHIVHRYEAGGILFSRLLPVIRHLVSIPAGIIRMPFGMFSLMTVIGAGIWCTVLAYFGKHVIGADPTLIDDPTKLAHFIKHQSLPVVGFAVVLAVLYFVGMWIAGRAKDKAV